MTLPITGGQVTYGRKVKPADYEGKDAIVMLSFNVEDGQDAQAVLDGVSHMAMTKALSMVGLQPRGTAEPTPPAGGKEAAAEKLNAADKDKTTTTRKRPPAAEKDQDKTPAKDPAAIDDGEPARQVSTTPEDRKDPSEIVDENIFGAEPETPAKVETLTDAQLTDAISTHNGKVKNAQEIRKLIGQYVKAPGQARDIPADKRAEFVAKLKEIKAP